MTEATESTVTIAEWPKNDHEVIRIALSEFRGNPTIEARVWYRDRAGELQPTRQGLTCHVRHLPELAASLAAALAEARARGLIGNDHDGGAA